MADMVGQAEEKERRLNKSRKRLEKKLVRRVLTSLHTLRVFYSRESLTIVNAHGTSLLPMCCIYVRTFLEKANALTNRSICYDFFLLPSDNVILL